MDKNFRIRLGLVFLLIAVLGVGVLVRAGLLMLVPSPRLTTAMNRQFRQEPPRMPRRGYIFDRNHEPIAVSMEVKSLFANPEKVKDPWQVSSLLARPLSLTASALRQRLKSEHAFVWLKRHLSDDETTSMENLFERRPTLGISLGLAKESQRFYPDRTLASQVMGFTGLDSNGLEGVELYYEKELAGVTDPKRNEDGESLELTIDKTLQYTLEEELARGLQESGGIAATGMIMDATTGDIIAMASAPTFNPNRYGQSTAEQRRNRSVTDTYEPGSVIKPLMMAGALENGVITPKTKVFCEYGKLQIGKNWVHEAETKDKWGWLTVGEVLQHSSNIGATKVAFDYGPDRMHAWYKRLGFTERTGIDLPGEAPGYMPKSPTWSRILLSNLSYGQGLAVTSLQVLRAYAAVANGGMLVTPRLVKRLDTFEGEPLRELPMGIKKRVMEKKTTEQLAGMLAAVATDEGTAPKAAIPGFTVIGKTGTSQKPEPGRGYRSGKHTASFVGFVRDVNPNYVVYVMVDEPHFPYFGGEVAAPIFRRIMAAVLAHEGIAPKTNSIDINTIGKNGPSLKAGDKVRMAASAPMEPAAVEPPVLAPAPDGSLRMPLLTGLTAREVMDVFSGKNYRLKIRGAGLVRAQQPLKGVALKDGDEVQVRLEQDRLLP